MKSATGLRLAAWIIAITLVALPVVGVLQGWFAANRWPVRQLEVHATFQHVSAAQLRTAVAPALGAGFFAVNLDKVRDAIAALPWVAHVEVSKHWPDALDITVTEIDPIAHWGPDALLSRDGHIFKVPDATIVHGLPRLDAPADRVDEVLAFYRNAQVDFAPYDLRVTAVALSARGSWTLTLSNDGTVTVGDHAPDQRLARFARALPILMKGRSDGFVYADLRYSNGFAVRWPQPAPAGAPASPSASPSTQPTAGVNPHAADGNV